MEVLVTKEELKVQEWRPAKFFDKTEQKWVESDTHEITKTGYVKRKNKHGQNRYSFNPNSVTFGYKGRSTKFNLAASIYATFNGPVSPNVKIRRENFAKHINIKKQIARAGIIVQTDLACRIINIGNSILSILEKNKDNSKITYYTIYHAVGSKSHIGGRYKWFYLEDFANYVHPSHIKPSQEIVEISEYGSIKRSWLTPEIAALDLDVSVDTLYKMINSVILDKHLPFVLDRNTYNYLLDTKAIDANSLIEEEWRPFYYISDSGNEPELMPEYEVSNLLNVRRNKNNVTKICNKRYVIMEKNGMRINACVRKAAYHVFKKPLEKGERLYLLPPPSPTVNDLVSSKITQLGVDGTFIREWLSPTELVKAGFSKFLIKKLKGLANVEPMYYKGYYWVFSEKLDEVGCSVFKKVLNDEEWRPVKYFDTKLGKYVESKTSFVSSQGRICTKYAPTPRTIKGYTIYITTQDGRYTRLSLPRIIYTTFIREPELRERIRIVNKELPLSTENVESSRIVGIDKNGNKVADWLNIAEASTELKINEHFIQRSVNSNTIFRGTAYYLYSYDTYINLQTKDKGGIDDGV